jgi:hypothetical protein
MSDLDHQNEEAVVVKLIDDAIIAVAQPIHVS